MVHPAPATLERDALYGYLLGKPHEASILPELVRQYEAFRRGETGEVPAVPFEFLTSSTSTGRPGRRSPATPRGRWRG